MTTSLRWEHTLVGLMVVLALFLAACTVHKPITSVKPTEMLPESFSGGSPLPPIDHWWQDLENGELDVLVEEALAENLTLRMAWARLDQARHVTKIAGAGRYPGLEFGLGIQQQNSGGTLPPGSPSNLSSLSATMTLSYQVDLWKKIENVRYAAILDFEAGREDLESTALTVASSAVELWISLVEQESVDRLLEEQLEVGKSYQKLVEARFGRGLSSAVDVYQQRLQVENIRGQFPRIKMQKDLVKHQLALLLGKQPTAERPVTESTLPLIKDLPPTGIPAVILRRRPDVRAAELRLFAADHRVAVAIADRYPSVSVSASIGGRSGEISNIFDQWFTNLAGNLLTPVIDAGRRKAEVERNRAVVQERFYQWESVLLNAYAEVENALVTEEGLLKTYDSTKKQIELAQLTLDRSRMLYVNGLTDYLPVLTSLQALQNLQRAEISIRKSLISNRIKLHSALGGAWSSELIEPKSSFITTG